MEKKSAKNCTLYHVVNKAVWADIGAASKAVNREDKLSRRYRDRDLAKFERSRRYRER